jgi:ankyrin repeat protein
MAYSDSPALNHIKLRNYQQTNRHAVQQLKEYRMPILHREIIVPEPAASEYLNAASWNGDVITVKRLLMRGVEINEANSDGQTALHYGAATGNDEIVEYLLRAGASPNVQEKEGFTPLMYAAGFGYIEIVNALIGAGADVNAKRIDDETALMLAAWSGHIKIIEALLEAGAEVNAKGGQFGGTALHCALYETHEDALDVLRQAPGVDLSLTDSQGMTVKEQAITKGRYQIARLL